jgi:putative PIN family toxin of toxin-antitoxin system
VPLTVESEGKINHAQLKSLIAGIAAFVSSATLVHPPGKLHICRDPKDDMLLECCLAAKADFLITGDKDILEIDTLPFALRIVSPGAFLRT